MGMERHDHLARQHAKVGSARIDIRYLRGSGFREIDEKNVKRLVKVFASDGCPQLEPAYSVPIVVSSENITKILQRNAIEVASLGRPTYPRLIIDKSSSLTCLHGQHRLAAGQVFLRDSEQWWGVDIYRAEGLFRLHLTCSQHILTYLRSITKQSSMDF